MKYSFITLLILSIIVQAKKLDAQLVSDHALVNRHENKFDYLTLSDGVDRNVSTTKKWNIALTNISGRYNPTVQEASSNYYGLADSYAKTYFEGLKEWGYSMHHLHNKIDGAGNLIVSGPDFGFDGVPSSPEDALSKTEAWFLKQIDNFHTPNTHFITKNAHYFYHHYGAGCYNDVDVIACEVGENIASINAHVAFTRGAARQYNKPFGINLSSWWGPAIRDYTRQWVKLGNDIQDVQVEGTRIGILLKDGTLQVKEGGLDASWTTVGSDVTAFKLNGDRIGKLESNGDFYVSEGEISDTWVLQLKGVDKFVLEGDRIIAILQTTGYIKFKEGDLTTAFSNLGSNSQKFLMDGDRIAKLEPNGTLKMIDGADPVKQWYTSVSSGVADFDISGDRIIILKKNNDLLINEGPITSEFTNVGSNVTAFDVENLRIGKIENGKLFIKEGDISSSWGDEITDEAISFKMTSSRVAYVDAGKNLFVNDGAIASAFYEMFGFTDKYELEGTRIVAMWDDGTLFGRDNELMSIQPEVAQLWKDGGPSRGHGISLSRRTFFNSYMSGANLLYPQAASANYFASEHDYQGKFMLSPLGRVGQDIYAFSHDSLNQEQRGVPWVPVAILMNRAHGLGLRTWSNNKIFSGLPMDDKDYMNKSLLQSIWGSSLVPQKTSDEYPFLQNNDLGEIFDVLLEDAPLNVLKKYAMIVLTGDLNLNATLVQKLADYVNAGGNLIVNVEYADANSTIKTMAGVNHTSAITTQVNQVLADGVLESFASQNIELKPLQTTQSATSFITGGSSESDYLLVSSNAVGNGKVFCVAFTNLRNDLIWKLILKNLVKRPGIVPFNIDGDIQYSYTYNPNEWIITLINNKGVNKTNTTLETIDHSFDQNIGITLQEADADILSVTELIDGQNIISADDAFSVDVAAGEVKIVRVSTQSTMTTKISNYDLDERTAKLIVFPNPTTGNTSFNKEVEEVQIYNASGVLIRTVNNVKTVDMSTCSKGMYLFKVRDAESTQNFKIIKM
ncbi:Por secretion system C-terminal sorting domain-containing protein [Mariniphaga anaerophila]|uniref:Por secretion system C-terminal sorting domain-containing protein n=1 Tax=Mariniphaga anaerophila TaxID=1484053 RepID=A0A1M4V9L7_9BACT|nr:T9SS type A sorting domain-containing protein [Mariniphaga anaerophila]SHE65645.1 Por secretion system C-terminal sorting domain-containing protein [Mariniphaga anaerophila]